MKTVDYIYTRDNERYKPNLHHNRLGVSKFCSNVDTYTYILLAPNIVVSVILHFDDYVFIYLNNCEIGICMCSFQKTF